ncbi:CBS domain-containing protein [Devosia sp. SD17-2]|uniref:CBS domain-containing protein n=1 Tax=Devosia sp. SD17-2 TaxID=2976459 RepID=UPI0023D7F98A|nr:CBS domain-containing protein [Devosia sp. SD17-2]WEJ35051.1 CBS domain-containing protein [Devosia sp. SD17-2]
MTDPVSGVMQIEYLTLDAAMPVRQAAGLLHANGQESAPVVNSTGDLVGILTQKDCFRPAMMASYYRQWRGNVGEQMSDQVKTIEADLDIVAAAEMFVAEPHRSFPVLRSGQLVGMLRREDVLGRLLQLG